MILLAIPLLLFAVPFTFYMIFDVGAGIWEWLHRPRSEPYEPPPDWGTPPWKPADGPQWWWRWQKTAAWHEAHKTEPSIKLSTLSTQPVPKKGRALAKTWKELGYKTGVINLDTGEVFEPREEEDGRTI